MSEIMELLETNPIESETKRRMLYSGARSVTSNHPIIPMLGPYCGFQENEGIIYHLPCWETPILKENEILYYAPNALKAHALAMSYAPSYFDNADIIPLREILHERGTKIIEVFTTLEPNLVKYVMVTQRFKDKGPADIPPLPLAVEQQILFHAVFLNTFSAETESTVILPFEFSEEHVASDSLAEQRRKMLEDFIIQNFILKE